MFEFKGKETDWTGFEFQDEDWVNWIIKGRYRDNRSFGPSSSWSARPILLPDLDKFYQYFSTEDLQFYYIEQLSQKLCQMETKLSQSDEPTTASASSMGSY